MIDLMQFLKKYFPWLFGAPVEKTPKEKEREKYDVIDNMKG